MEQTRSRNAFLRMSAASRDWGSESPLDEVVSVSVSSFGIPNDVSVPRRQAVWNKGVE